MQSATPLLLIDTHVHVHDCFDLSTFLDSAYSNCHTQVTHQQHQGEFLGVMLLTESAWDHWFQKFVDLADQREAIMSHSNNQWTLHRTEEDFTLVARSNQGKKLLIGAGRQIVTKEKLEVLALLTSQRFEDGMDIQEAINQVKESDGIPVIPWGFGKWWGKRGAIVTNLLRSQNMSDVFLGDNSGRPSFLPYPSQFTLANQLGIQIFPGSDPLPFLSENDRPCSVGLTMFGALEDTHPGTGLRQLLRGPNLTHCSYFQPERLFRFVKNQVAMQVVKHR